MNIYTISEFAILAHCSIETLQRWDRTGILKAGRTITNRRYYTQEHLDRVLKGPKDK